MSKKKVSKKKDSPGTQQEPAERTAHTKSRTPTEKAKRGNEDQATVEEFDREGMGVAPKE